MDPSAKPLLFEITPQRPTTRTIALQVREHGIGSLDQAQRRADEARYQEVTCRSALNPVKGMPFNWTLNPYRGCTHGCHYCFARRYQTQFELGPDDEFSSLIFVKVNFAEVLRRELDKPSWTRELVGARHRHRSLSADRRALQADARRRSKRWSPAARPSASSRRGRWSCATRTCSPSSPRWPSARSASACRPSTRTRGGRWNRAPRTRCNGCAPSAGCAMPESTPAC